MNLFFKQADFTNCEVLPWKAASVDEHNIRTSIDPLKLCTYGIEALDNALGGILPNDLVVIGADSGCGKSELALRTAVHNARKGKRVCLFYLEGGYTEAIARIKWPLITFKYYTQYPGSIENFSYANWRRNLISNPLIHKIEAEVVNNLNKQVNDKLFICKITSEFKLENLLTALNSFDNLSRFDPKGSRIGTNNYSLDLVIIDHLQYFALKERQSEHQSIKEIMYQVKKLTDDNYLPVILISHLRKKSKERGLPGQEDFHGSSDIAKIASTGIVLALDTENIDHANKIYPTYFRIVKSRIGASDSIAMRSNFVLNFRRYENNYDLHLVNGLGHVKSESIPPDQYPDWAIQNKELVKDLNHECKSKSLKRFYETKNRTDQDNNRNF
jgi:KaiC/GvpD/RAD55 family RecA-like ATPase